MYALLVCHSNKRELRMGMMVRNDGFHQGHGMFLIPCFFIYKKVDKTSNL